MPLVDTVLQIAPFTVRLRSPFAAVQRHLDNFYVDVPRGSISRDFVDFDVQVLPARGLRRVWHPQARFLLDGEEPFFPLPAEQAAPLFEWGMNWCVAQRPLGELVMHAAVVAQGDAAVMMPGFPGAGKSTLCAALVHLAGWRLLSDELAILDPATGTLLPHPRPISLKNASIAVVQAFQGARLGPVYRDTRKGDITHAACPGASQRQANVPASVRWVVFPRFEAGAAPHCEALSRAEAFVLISEQSFNNERMGEVGFDALCALLTGAECFEMVYGSTTDALALVRQITGGKVVSAAP
ncbi:MAG: HprK-related kinase A [Polaromonas sp.]|uniref:HprK-related kinase A n=1 Tax=Polaromonas sp. TaxID=1869339 RepID=UPI002718D163|nr:HprK-related kinase A [Polaromonas sp.]MDO9112691.1 HprK-related kinase A [Polaromonas sp.]